MLMQHDLTTVLWRRAKRKRITALHYNVSREEADLSSECGIFGLSGRK